MRAVPQIALKHSMALHHELGQLLWRDLAITLPLEQH